MFKPFYITLSERAVTNKYGRNKDEMYPVIAVDFAQAKLMFINANKQFDVVPYYDALFEGFVGTDNKIEQSVLEKLPTRKKK